MIITKSQTKKMIEQIKKDERKSLIWKHRLVKVLPKKFDGLALLYDKKTSTVTTASSDLTEDDYEKSIFEIGWLKEKKLKEKMAMFWVINYGSYSVDSKGVHRRVKWDD